MTLLLGFLNCETPPHPTAIDPTYIIAVNDTGHMLQVTYLRGSGKEMVQNIQRPSDGDVDGVIDKINAAKERAQGNLGALLLDADRMLDQATRVIVDSCLTTLREAWKKDMVDAEARLPELIPPMIQPALQAMIAADDKKKGSRKAGTTQNPKPHTGD